MCLSNTYEMCTGEASACAPGEECPPPAPAVCETITDSACVYQHEAPCTANADCGAGFLCKEMESCWCSEPAPAPTPDGSEPAPMPEPVPPEGECGCEPSGTFYC